jgi:hypothetical protein
VNKGLIGRFQTPDPYQPSAKPSSPQSWNRYAYVENDPANALDPTGLFLLARQADGNDGGGDGAGDGWFYGTLFYGVPWPIGPELPIIRGGGGGGGAVSFASAKAAFQRAAKDLSSKKFSKNCEKDLTALHVSDNQVHSDAAAAVFLNGVGNKTPVSQPLCQLPGSECPSSWCRINGNSGHINRETGNGSRRAIGRT